MFSRPAAFQDFLSRNNHIDDIYDAMAKDDLSEVVVKALEVLRRTNNLPPLPITRKSANISVQFRVAGNEAYKIGLYQRALICYNQALLLAPKNSREMKLAFSNRSALFLHLKLYNACNVDIEICLTTECPAEILTKLLKRKEIIKPYLEIEKLGRSLLVHAADNCINLNSMSQNSVINCASSDVKFVGSDMPKIIASKDIKSGTALAVEEAFTSYTDTKNDNFSCHFCQKKSFNLIPCDGCCYALFCDEECKSRCISEFHEIECKIMDAMKITCFGPMPNLMVKASLKLKMKCKTWNKLIDASFITGTERIKSSSPKDIYNGDKIFSVLSFKDDKPFIYGVLYDACFVCAAILHYLDGLIPSFFPTDPKEKQQALRALGRIMMFLSIYQIPLHIIQAHTCVKTDQSNYGMENYGIFPFISKLKNSSNPNSVLVNINNKLVLFAIHSIRCGEDITVPYAWHRYDNECEGARNVKTFLFHGTVEQNQDYGDKLSNAQKKYFSKLNINAISEKVKNIEVTSVYPKLLEALVMLSDVPNSKEYMQIYKYLRWCLFFFEVVKSDNNILDNVV